jgi:hypothetical protein
MGIVCYAAAAALPAADSRATHALHLAVVIPLGVAVFYAAARVFRIPELDNLTAALRSRP